MIAVAATPEGVILPVLAHPGAKRNAVVGERAGALRVAVSSPPEKGKANAAIQAVLAEGLGCKSSQVRLVGGATSRQKRFVIQGMAVEVVRERLLELLPDTNQDA